MSRVSMLNLSVFPRMEDLQEESVEMVEMVDMEAAEDGDEVTLTEPPDVARPALRCFLGSLILLGGSFGAALIFLYILHQFSV